MMNADRQKILRLCSQEPRTTRQLVHETGDTPSAIRSRLHYLSKIGALTHTDLNDRYGTRLYRVVQGWRPKGSPELTAYRPLGICVWGVWM